MKRAKAFFDGLMKAGAGDVVRLAQMDVVDDAVLRKLDLRLLAEYERKPGGAVRVKLLDRTALAVALLRDGGEMLADDKGGSMASFLAAMQAAAIEGVACDEAEDEFGE